MENQHRKITGYRELSQEEIDIMNKLKSKGAEVAALIEELRQIQNKEFDALCMADRGSGSDDERAQRAQKFEQINDAKEWRIDGARTVQKGFMALIRSVARPTTFC